MFPTSTTQDPKAIPPSLVVSPPKIDSVEDSSKSSPFSSPTQREPQRSPNTSPSKESQLSSLTSNNHKNDTNTDSEAMALSTEPISPVPEILTIPNNALTSTSTSDQMLHVASIVSGAAASLVNDCTVTTSLEDKDITAEIEVFFYYTIIST